MVVVREPVVGADVAIERDPAAIGDRLQSYLGDESKLRAESARGVAFPNTVEELSALVARCAAEKSPIRVSGARTGITGACVPEPEDIVISLERISGVVDGSLVLPKTRDGRGTVRVRAGTTLAALQAFLAEHAPSVYFPVDPTETWAALGGMASTNASGARTFRFGPMRNWVRAATIVLADGGILALERGRDRYEAGTISLSGFGGSRQLAVRAIPRPPTKNTVGYHLDTEGDLLDLFIGSEGTLGIFAELTLDLISVPENRLVFLQVFDSDDQALRFIRGIRERAGQELLAVEFIDRRGLEFVRQSAAGGKTAPAQLLDDRAAAALVLEIDSVDDDALADVLGSIEEVLAAVGADSARSFAGTTDRDLREVKTFRHAVPEGINALIASRREAYPGLHKVATDMAVPDSALEEIYHLYRSELDRTGLDYAIFGHGGNNHFHVNILPRSLEELAEGKKLYRSFAERVVALGGAVAAEHGIGRMKRQLLELQFESRHLEMMRRVRHFFDPDGLLNRGVLFDDVR